MSRAGLARRLLETSPEFQATADQILTSLVDPNWIWLGVFVGANLAQSGLTDFRPLASLLKRAGFPDAKSCCS